MGVVKWRDEKVGKVLVKRRNVGDTGGKLYVDERGVEGLRMMIRESVRKGEQEKEVGKGGGMRDEEEGRKKER